MDSAEDSKWVKLNGDYKSTTAQKPQSDRPDKERTPEFVDEIRVQLNNDPIYWSI